jgi:hypothetical protein
MVAPFAKHDNLREVHLFGETAPIHTYADGGPAVNSPRSKSPNVQLRPWKLGHFRQENQESRICALKAIFKRHVLGYGGLPFTTLEVKMSSAKARMYPFVIAAITIIASTGGVWRII